MSVEELLNEAVKSYMEEKIYDTVMYLETVLEIEEGNLKALTMLSRIYTDMGLYDDALKYSEISYKKYSDNLEVLFDMGYLNQALGKRKKALSFYEEYVRREENYHVLLNMGLCHMEMKHYKKALSIIDKAIIKNTSNSEGYMDKAECLVRMKEFDKAMKIYEERLQSKENNIDEYYIYMRMGDLENMRGDIEEAIKYYNIAINFEDAQEFVYENFYEMLLKENKRDEIELLLINFANSGIEKEKILNMEGRYASYIKDFKRAEKVCDKLLILNPENPMHYFNSAYVREMQEKFEEAVEFLEKGKKYITDEEFLKNTEKRIKKLKKGKKKK